MGRDTPPPPSPPGRPTREAALAAVRTLLAWIGEDPGREGLRETPERVVGAFGEHFAGYAREPARCLESTFEEAGGFDGLVLLRDIGFESHCEHHMAPFFGRAHVAYLPARRIVGIGKLAELVEGYAKRLQVQERLTAQIADAIQEVLAPRGVAVVIEATHTCMTTRGPRRAGATVVTSRLLGAFAAEGEARRELLPFLSFLGRPVGPAGGGPASG